jgi:alkaline phosphatase D
MLDSMSIRRVVLLVAFLLPAGCEPASSTPDVRGPRLKDSRTLTRIAFGSCAHQDRPQPIWDAIAAMKPDVMVLLGDNIYADTRDMDVMKAKYAKAAAIPQFAAFRRKVPILATWDDHDMGLNDVGADYPYRRESQQIFLDFFSDPPDSQRRMRDGVYKARVLGPKGRRVQIILLDTRFFRSDLKSADPPRRMYDPKNPKADELGHVYVPAKTSRYAPDPDPAKTMLGQEQWQWLEEQLRVPAELRIIASSIQVAADDHPWEKWENLPLERERLLRTIREAGAGGVIVISGDRHRAEICKLDDAVGYTLWDITSSSLTNPSQPDKQNDPSRRRVGNNYIHVNFGLIRIDWKKKDPALAMEIRDGAGTVVLSQELRLSELKAGGGTTQPARPK